MPVDEGWALLMKCVLERYFGSGVLAADLYGHDRPKIADLSLRFLEPRSIRVVSRLQDSVRFWMDGTTSRLNSRSLPFVWTTKQYLQQDWQRLSVPVFPVHPVREVVSRAVAVTEGSFNKP